MGQTVALCTTLEEFTEFFRLFGVFKNSGKKGKSMKYLIDHNSKFVHEIQYATDRCKTHTTLEGPKEYTDSSDYISQLESRKSYMKCPYCHEVPLLMD